MPRRGARFPTSPAAPCLARANRGGSGSPAPRSSTPRSVPGRGANVVPLVTVTVTPPQAPFEVPEPREIAEVPLSDGEAIIMRCHGNPDGPRLLMSHGNGLAIDLYYPFWGAFLRDFEVVVFDLRNHGWNRVGDVYGHNMPQFARDLERVQAAVTQRLGEKPTMGVYHSASALAIAVSESRGEGYAGLFLLDPPFCKPGHTFVEFDAAVEAASRRLLRQEPRFQRIEQYVELLEFNPFRHAVPGAADLAARSTLRRERDGASFAARGNTRRRSSST